MSKNMTKAQLLSIVENLKGEIETLKAKPVEKQEVRALPAEEPATQAQIAFIVSLSMREDVPAGQRKWLVNYLSRPNKARMGARNVIRRTKQIMLAAQQ